MEEKAVDKKTVDKVGIGKPPEFKEKDNLAKGLWLFQCHDIEIDKSKKAHNYDYAPLDTIMKAIRPYLKSTGIGISHTIETEKNKETLSTGNKIIVVKHYLVTCIFNPDDKEDFQTCTNLIKDDVELQKMNTFMVMGAAITYLRRYHVTTLLGLTTEEDTDAGGKKSGISSNPKEKAVTDYVKIFQNQLDKGKTKENVQKALDNYKSKMTEEDFNTVSSMIESKFEPKK